MKIKKILCSMGVTAALVISICSTALASTNPGVDVAGKKTEGGIPIPATVSITEDTQKSTIRATSPGVYDVEVYPADSRQQIYYSEMYTSMNGNGGQWANGTLGAKTAALYREKNCDSVYVIATYFTGNKRYYQLLSNSSVVDQGSVSSNSAYTLSVLVKINPNPQYLDYGSWRMKLHDGNVSTSYDLWGFIYLPAE